MKDRKGNLILNVVSKLYGFINWAWAHPGECLPFGLSPVSGDDSCMYLRLKHLYYIYIYIYIYICDLRLGLRAESIGLGSDSNIHMNTHKCWKRKNETHI